MIYHEGNESDALDEIHYLELGMIMVIPTLGILVLSDIEGSEEVKKEEENLRVLVVLT